MLWLSEKEDVFSKRSVLMSCSRNNGMPCCKTSLDARGAGLLATLALQRMISSSRLSVRNSYNMLQLSVCYLPNTVFSRSVVRAAGLVRIFFSSSPTMKKRPSSALLVT